MAGDGQAARPPATVVDWRQAVGGLAALAAVGWLVLAVHGDVKELDSQIKEVWLFGKRVARNTSSTWMLEETATLAENLRDAVGEVA